MQLNKIIKPALTAALFATLALTPVLGCAHTSASETTTPGQERVSPASPQLVAHENLHRLEGLSHMTSTTAELRVCVAPDGSAKTVEIKSGSGSSWFAREAVSELMSASYQPFAAPAEIRVCGPIQIVFD